MGSGTHETAECFKVVVNKEAQQTHKKEEAALSGLKDKIQRGGNISWVMFTHIVGGGS